MTGVPQKEEMEMSVRQAKCVNCGHGLIENPKAGEWLHRSTAERACNSLIPGTKAKPMPWTITE